MLLARRAVESLQRSTDRIKLKQQRHDYMKMTYKSVPLKTIMSFRKRVRHNFEMFGYDCSPKDVFDGRTMDRTENNIFSRQELSK